MENKNLIFVISIIVIVFLAGGLLLVQQQKIAGMQEKSGRLILNNPEIQIVQNDAVEYPAYINGSMLADCCVGNDWQRIHLDAIVSGGQSRPCLFVHPRVNGTVNLTYKNIKLKKTLSFATAIADPAVTGGNAPVFLDVYINDSLVQRITQADKQGWFTTDVNTEQYQNKMADVKLVISTDNNFQRWFCFDAQTVE